MAEIENRGPQLLGVDVFFIILALITTLLRCYVRIFMVKSWGKEDWFMLAATVGHILLSRARIIELNNYTTDCVCSLLFFLDIWCPLWNRSSLCGLDGR
jgi:hypothetical protein